MAVDASMRKLKIPPRFVPYMEKHRIYELFHDLGNELAINRPADPLTFLKTCLEQVDKCRDRRLVVLIAPPFLDRIKLAHLMSVKNGCGILSRYLCIKNPIDFYNPMVLAKGTLDKINNSDQKDWIFADFPNTAEEAEELISIGVLPTHAILFLSEERQNENKEELKVNTVDTTPSLLFDYDNNVYRLRKLFKSSLKVVKIKDRTIEELAAACATMTMKMPPRKVPKLFRLALLGPRGSRRRTIARLISRQFNMVHVDMEQLINSTRVAETAAGDELRYLDKNGLSYTLKTVFNLLKRRLSEEDCINRGYVLTNFPTSIEDFVLLDSLETPPNRVVFLEIDGEDCQERLEDRVVNEYSGALHSMRNDPMNPDHLHHPDDESCKVENEIRFYNERFEALKEYCGETAFFVDARGPTNALLERIEDVLMGPPPAAKPRTGKLPQARPPVKRSASETSAESSISWLPRPTRTEVVPMIESVELLRRFSDLKKRVKSISESSSTDDGDFIMRELNKEFAMSLKG